MTWSYLLIYRVVTLDMVQQHYNVKEMYVKVATLAGQGRGNTVLFVAFQSPCVFQKKDRMKHYSISIKSEEPLVEDSSKSSSKDESNSSRAKARSSDEVMLAKREVESSSLLSPPPSSREFKERCNCFKKSVFSIDCRRSGFVTLQQMDLVALLLSVVPVIVVEGLPCLGSGACSWGEVVPHSHRDMAGLLARCGLLAPWWWWWYALLMAQEDLAFDKCDLALSITISKHESWRKSTWKTDMFLMLFVGKHRRKDVVVQKLWHSQVLVDREMARPRTNVNVYL